MSWRIVVISSRAKLDLQMNYLVVRCETTTKIHLSEISILMIESTAVSLTAYLLSELMKRKIKVIFCDEKRNPSSELVSYYGSHDTSIKVRQQIAWKPDMAGKSLYNYVVYDSAGVERSFAEALDKQEEVLVFAKLPSAFKIDTPLGSYNPDWAYVEESDGERRVYFVTETKGGKNGEPALRDAEKIKIGCAKKHFEALDLGNDFHYNVRTTYQYEAVKA